MSAAPFRWHSNRLSFDEGAWARWSFRQFGLAFGIIGMEIVIFVAMQYLTRYYNEVDGVGRQAAVQAAFQIGALVLRRAAWNVCQWVNWSESKCRVDHLHVYTQHLFYYSFCETTLHRAASLRRTSEWPLLFAAFAHPPAHVV
jgi:hypothetical protein